MENRRRTMAADYGDTINLEPEEIDFGETSVPEKKDNKTIWIIVAVVAVILLCCCLVIVLGGVWLWNNGDQLLEDWSAVYHLANYFLS
jgi:hypothetical protein